MTTLNKTILAALAVSIFSISCGTSTDSSNEQSLAAKPQADFSFINKSKGRGPVWIALMNERGNLFSIAFGAAEVDARLENSRPATRVEESTSGIFGKSITATAIPHNDSMGVSSKMYLAIYLEQPPASARFANTTAKFSPEPDYVFSFSPIGKTIYVTWHGDTNTLDPQTGPLGGLLGTNEDGWPLGNNVSTVFRVWPR